MLHLKADAAAFQGVNFRARYEYGRPSGSGLDEASLVEIGEQPELRHYDLADRTRNRFVGQVDVNPTEALTFSLSGGFGADDYDDSTFGLQEAAFRNVTFGLDYQTPNGVIVGGSYDYERYWGSSSRVRPARRTTGRSQPGLDGRQRRTRPLFLDLPATAAHGTDRGARL